jgi:hypothetical protein
MTFSTSADVTNTAINAFTMGRRPGLAVFDGFIDDLRIWNRGLSPDEIRQLYYEGY